MPRAFPQKAIALAAAVALMFCAVGADAVPSVEWLSDVFLCAAMALSAYAGGWIGAAVAICLAPFVLTAGGHDTWQRLIGEWLEATIVALTTAFARDRVVRFRRSESKLRALFGSLPDIVAVLDRNGHCTKVLATDRSTDETPANLFPAAIAERVRDEVRMALANGRRRTIDFSQDEQGSITWWSATISPLVSGDALWVARDETVKNRAEQVLQETNVELEKRVEERVRELHELGGALRRSEKLHRAIVEQASDVIFTLDSEGVIVSLNPIFERVIGWPPELWVGRPFAALVCGDAPFHLDGPERGAGHGTLPLQRVFICGRERRVHLEMAVVNLVVDGRSTGFLGMARDVTERELAQEELRRSERQLAESQRIAKLGSFEIDLPTGEIRWSDEHYSVFDVDKSDAPMTMARFSTLLSPEQVQHAGAMIKGVIDNGEGEWQLMLTDRDGAERTISSKARLIRDESGVPTSIQGTAQDVTERTRAERILRETEERFNLMGQATHDLVWDWDPVRNITWWGEGMRDLFGYSADEANEPDFWYRRIHPDDHERVITEVARFLASSATSLTMEFRFRRRDGTYAQVLERGYAVRSPEGVAVRMVGATQDITSRKQMEEQLAQAHRVNGLGRIAASIAHEFNNVLMGLQPNLEVLQRRAPQHLHTFVDHMVHSVARGQRVTSEILNFTRRATPTLHRVDVTKFLRMCEHELTPLLGPNVALHLDVAPHLSMLADEPQMAQVLTNLALNARDAMPDGGFLTIRARERTRATAAGTASVQHTSFVELAVIDTGIGMSAKELDHIFEPMFTTKANGIGLGLAVTYQIVSRHDGSIAAESRPGAGTTFTILIPSAEADSETATIAVPGQLLCRRVLIVEDDSAVAAGLTTLLEMEQVEVEVVGTATAAIPAIERNLPDVLILDIGLPDRSGIDLYIEIEKRWPSLPVIFSSGHGDETRLDQWQSSPHVHVLLKPYDFAVLEAALVQVLGATTRSIGDAATMNSATRN